MSFRSRSSSLLLLSTLGLAISCTESPTSPRPTASLSRHDGRTSLSGPRDIRIGVVQAATSISLGSASDWTIADKESGVVLFSGSGGDATITAAVPAAFYRLQVTCSNATTVASKRAAADAAGYVTLTEFVPAANCTRLFLGQFAPPPASNFGARNALRNAAIAAGHAGMDSFWKVVALGSATYTVTRGSNKAETTNPVVVSASSGLVTINGATYRGKGEAISNGTGALAGVNVLPMEHYLYGVVPRELGPVAFPEVEAQKAQAVAARTYAIAGLGKRASNGYDLRATTDDQVYGGYAAEHAISNAAVDATAGIVLTHEGTLITALYSSTSGGHTADNEESFASAEVPYLRGIPDAPRGNAFSHVPSLEVFNAHANPTSLRASKEGDFDSDWSRLHRWTFEWNNDEISDIVSTFAQTDVGRVLGIEVLDRGPSGRALGLAYVTEAGTFVAEKFAIRTSLTFITSTGSLSALPSTLFFIEEIRDPRTKELKGFRVYGGGFGHGVGLSQTGAVGMAEKGATFDEILRHYYRSVDVTQWY